MRRAVLSVPSPPTGIRSRACRGTGTCRGHHRWTGARADPFPLEPVSNAPAESSPVDTKDPQNSEQAGAPVASGPTEDAATADQAESTARLEPVSNAPSGSAPVNPKYPIEEGTATTADETAREVQNDVIPEQVAGGAGEPAPTPGPEVAGGEQAKEAAGQAEVIAGDNDLDRVDSGVQEAKGKEVERNDTPVVEEVNEAEGVPPGARGQGAEAAAEPGLETSEAPAAVPAKREQQRVENPIYTLEVVGNKYKTDAFWSVQRSFVVWI